MTISLAVRQLASRGHTLEELQQEVERLNEALASAQQKAAATSDVAGQAQEQLQAAEAQVTALTAQLEASALEAEGQQAQWTVQGIPAGEGGHYRPKPCPPCFVHHGKCLVSARYCPTCKEKKA